MHEVHEGGTTGYVLQKCKVTSSGKQYRSQVRALPQGIECILQG